MLAPLCGQGKERKNMNATKILEEEISDLKIASLPTRPTERRGFGGGGYSASEVKEAFDKLPLFIIEKFNALIDDIVALGKGSLADSIPTGIDEGHTLRRLFEDIENGNLAGYMMIGGQSLASQIVKIKETLGIP